MKINAIPNLASCSICDKELRHSIRIYSNVDGVINGNYKVGICASCGAGKTIPYPQEETLSDFYSKGVYQNSGGHFFGIIDPFLRIMSDWKLKEINHYYRIPGKILDVGCGKGRFLSNAKVKGWEVQGVEYSKSQIDFAVSRYGLEIKQGGIHTVNFEENCFDVVMAWHVLEHISIPYEFMAEVNRILKRGGLFVCEVPNFSSWQAHLGKENWFHLDVPRHLTHFTPKAMEKLLEQNDFALLELHTFSLENGPIGMLQSIINRIGLPPNWLWRWLKRCVSDNIFLLLINLFFVLIGIIPSIILECMASINRSGGVVRIVARKK